MAKKPTMTIDDHYNDELEKMAEMTDEELDAYLAELEEISEEAKNLGIRTVSMDDLEEGDEDIPFLTLDNIGTYMAVWNGEFALKHRSKEGKKSKYRSKIYITAHHEDFAKHFDEIAEKFLSTYNCDVYYYDDFEEDVDNEVYDHLLSQMNLMVVLVTKNFLDDENRAKDLDIAIAMDYKIPLLPIYIDGDIEKFNQEIGNIELLDKNSPSFDGKLSKFLRGKVADDALFQRIKKEFTKKIFLSYRKKDLAEAKKLLEIIKEMEEMWDTSVWYDDYLTPGEDYNDEIDNAIDECDLFLLLVTPNLLEEGNYVSTIEYPKAEERKKPVLAVEAKETDLDGTYSNISSKTALKDRIKVAKDIVKSMKFGKVKKDTSPEHLFYIGLAYHYGIGVLRDTDVAFKLLVQSAEQGFVPAVSYLTEVKAYSRMIPPTSLLPLCEKALEVIEVEFEKGNYINLDTYWAIADSLVSAYFSTRNYDKEKDLIQKMMNLNPRLSRKASRLEEMARLCFRLSVLCDVIGEDQEMVDNALKAGEYITEAMEMDSADKPYALCFSVGYCLLKAYSALDNAEAFDQVFDKLDAFYKSLGDKVNLKITSVDFEYAQFLQGYSSMLFTFRRDRSMAYAQAQKAIDILLSIEETSLTASVVATLYLTMSTYYFHDGKVDESKKCGKLAVDYARKNPMIHHDSFHDLLAKALFSYANVHFQTDDYEVAEKHFAELVEYCYENDFHSKLMMLKMSSDYYGQLLVILKRYDEAFAKYADFVNFVIKNEIKNDVAFSYCADCSFRAGIVALDYMDDEKFGLWGIQNALAFIAQMKNPTPEMLRLKQRIYDMFS